MIGGIAADSGPRCVALLTTKTLVGNGGADGDSGAPAPSPAPRVLKNPTTLRQFPNQSQFSGAHVGAPPVRGKGVSHLT